MRGANPPTMSGIREHQQNQNHRSAVAQEEKEGGGCLQDDAMWEGGNEKEEKEVRLYECINGL